MKMPTQTKKSPNPPIPAQPHPIIIVGAGLAGLSAALHLAERGLSPLVLEADPRYPGGRVAGGDVVELTHAGKTWRFRDEHGVHGIWSPYHNLQAMLTRYNVRPMFVPAQEEVWIYKRGGRVYQAPTGSAIRHSWLPAPFHYLTLFLRPRFLGMLGLRDWLTLPRVWYSLVFALGIDPLREGQPLEGLWLSDFVKGWAPALRAFFVGLARNGLSAHPEEIPLSGFVAFLRFYTLLRRDAWAFSYMPADGGSSLIEPLAGKPRELGGTLEMGHSVTRLERGEDGWRVHWCPPLGPPPWGEGEGGTEEGGSYSARQIILATDAANAEKILRASPPLVSPRGGEGGGEGIADLYWPRAMPTAVMRLWFDRSPDANAEAGIFSGEFTLDNYFWLHRIQNAYVEWHKASGGSAVEVHLYGPPELLEEPDAVLLARAISEVNSAFPELRGHLIHQFIRRNETTHTLFSVGPAGRHLGIETPWPDLFCCGDWVRHPSPAFFLERACVTGIEAANAVLRCHQSPTWPLLSGPPPERLAGSIERLMQWGRRKLRRRNRAR
jgi:uncharacterized protein with NAD-binding domain and iron-sulfur cluster